MIDHDQRFKALWQEFFEDFFRLFLPDWADRLEFEQIDWLDKEVFADPPRGERTILDFVQAYAPLDDRQNAELDALLRTEPYQEIKPMIRTLYDQDIEKSREPGREEGGRSALILVLEGRFGTLPDSIRRRVAALSPEQLARALRESVVVKSLDELGLGNDA